MKCLQKESSQKVIKDSGNKYSNKKRNINEIFLTFKIKVIIHTGKRYYILNNIFYHYG